MQVTCACTCIHVYVAGLQAKLQYTVVQGDVNILIAIIIGFTHWLSEGSSRPPCLSLHLLHVSAAEQREKPPAVLTAGMGGRNW